MDVSEQHEPPTAGSGGPGGNCQPLEALDLAVVLTKDPWSAGSNICRNRASTAKEVDYLIEGEGPGGERAGSDQSPASNFESSPSRRAVTVTDREQPREWTWSGSQDGTRGSRQTGRRCLLNG